LSTGRACLSTSNHHCSGAAAASTVDPGSGGDPITSIAIDQECITSTIRYDICDLTLDEHGSKNTGQPKVGNGSFNFDVMGWASNINTDVDSFNSGTVR
jgi:hypothetical protein